MSLNDFFKNTLGANLKNNRWSWGADNNLTNQCFLRVWKDEVTEHKQILILDKTQSNSNGLNERVRHIEKIKLGAKGYGVLCIAKNPDESPRSIKKYDNEYLLELGEIIETENKIFADIIGKISVESIPKVKTSQSTLLIDLNRIFRKKNITEKEILSNARIGQGKFRSDILKMWDSKCSVTGSTITNVLRASHIKPWRECDNLEKLDPNNGLPLIATLDALFDFGLISFQDNGKIIISNKIPENERRILNLDKSLKLRKLPNYNMKKYLSYHRNYILKHKIATNGRYFKTSPLEKGLRSINS